MKNLFLLFVICTCASCNPPEKLISRSWKFREIIFDTNGNSKPGMLEKRIEEELTTDITFTFARKDSAYTVLQVKANQSSLGKWWFSKDKKEFFTRTNRDSLEARIVELKKNSLIYEARNSLGRVARFICVPIATKRL